MLRDVKHIEGFKIKAEDGTLGKVKEFLFDDEQFKIRYLVVDTGTWLPGRKVLISPEAFGNIDWEDETFSVHLTKEKVENSPDIKEHLPVAREHEYELNQYYGWHVYWAAGPVVLNPAMIEPDLERYGGDSHLRSTDILSGFLISARDGTIGHLDNFILDDSDWSVRFLVISYRHGLHMNKVLICPDLITGINLRERHIDIDRDREEVIDSPDYAPELMDNPEYEKIC